MFRVGLRIKAMAPLKVGMTHADAAEHLRQEVIGTCQYETGRLLGPPGPAFFGAARAILSDVDYVAALYAGAQGRARRDIGKRDDAVAFLRAIVARATGDAAYATYAWHLRDMFRVGTVHFRAPKQIENKASSTPTLSWGLMEDRTEDFEYPTGSGNRYSGTHLQLCVVDTQKTILPVSIRALFDDFIAACEHFARALEAEATAGGNKLITRWRSVADVWVTPEPSKLVW
jgi:hypothetical protein